jgi:hypothetical protein
LPRGNRPEPPKPQGGSFDAVPSLATVEVDGPLQSSVIRRAAERMLAAYRDCYRDAARHARTTPATSVRVSFEIDETRSAQAVRAGAGALPGLGSCVEEATARIRTRVAPDVGNAKVTVVVRFEPTSP